MNATKIIYLANLTKKLFFEALVTLQGVHVSLMHQSM
jgi:hypothetical protein